MISWIIELPELRRFVSYSTKKKQKILAERQQVVARKKKELARRFDEAEALSDHVCLRRSREASEQEIRRLRSDLQEPIAGIYSLMNDYTRDLLWLEIHRALAVDGYTMPEELTALRQDIDYGLLNLEQFEGIEDVLKDQVDPFSDIEDSVLRELGVLGH
jgi:hypothetical protein